MWDGFFLCLLFCLCFLSFGLSLALCLSAFWLSSVVAEVKLLLALAKTILQDGVMLVSSVVRTDAKPSIINLTLNSSPNFVRMKSINLKCHRHDPMSG